jgi:hypothetical protein
MMSKDYFRCRFLIAKLIQALKIYFILQIILTFIFKYPTTYFYQKSSNKIASSASTKHE